MTFASKKDLQSTRKFELIRLNPARYIVDDLLSIGGGKYTYSTSYFVNKVEESGVALSEVTGTPMIGEYSFNENTSLLTIYPYATPSSTNPITMFHYLFFTGEIYRTWYQDPDDSNTPLRDWRPLLKESPSINQSVEDLLAGILSVSISNIEILNRDYELNEYLTLNDSFYNKEVKVWLCLDDESNSQKIFEGRTGDITVSKESMILDVSDSMSLLFNPALMGDSPEEAYYTLDDNPNLNSNGNGMSRPWIVGTCSRYQTVSESISGLSNAQRLDYNTLYTAICINYSNTVSNSTNRNWGLCRTASAGFQDFTHTVISVDNSNPNFTKFTSSTANVAKMYIGDTFIVNYLGTDYYGRVLYVDRVYDNVYTTPIVASGTPTIQGNNCPSIVIVQDSVAYYLNYGLHYTASVTITTGGNKLLDITLVNGFETSLGMTDLDPSADVVYYRVRPSRMLHGELVKEIVETAGLVVNSASVTNANALLPVYASMSIPSFDEIDYEDYYKYLQHVLESTFSYVSLNNNFELEYALFADPTSSDEITDTEILLDSYMVKVNYKDIISQLIAYNPHANSVEFVDKTGTSLKSLKSQYLHGFARTVRFQHCLEDITGRISQILKYRSNRVAKYSIDTATKNLDSKIGDDFKLNKVGLLGELTKQVKLIGIDKKSTMASIILTDLGV